MTRGGKNLILLTVGAIAIATITTGVSLAVYHNSGDIYLDRSRPGFLPDEAEQSEEQNQDTYKFSESGNLDKQSLTEYLQNIQKEMNRLNKVKNPFDESALSDENLGITGKKVENTESNSDGVDTNQDAQHIND